LEISPQAAAHPEFSRNPLDSLSTSVVFAANVFTSDDPADSALRTDDTSSSIEFSISSAAAEGVSLRMAVVLEW
jgi:hypothetical protein